MIGTTVSHYRILEKLGEGGMGVVYRAEDIRLRRPVALKFLSSELTRGPEARKRFIREAQAASALDHPNICTVHEVDETDDGRIFIAMACYEGQTLKDRIAAGPLKLRDAVDIVRRVAKGLAKAHRQHIVHRDIKPANIFLTRDGEVKIVDFGLAKVAGQSRVTRTGTTLGTVAYMSPEQARGEQADPRSDLWSLGAAFYEMVTGVLPFRGEHEQAVLHAILHRESEPVTGVRSGVPLELERIVGKCLEKDPEERYQTAEDLIADLRHYQRTEEAPTIPYHPTPKETAPFAAPNQLWRKRAFRYGLTILALGALIAVGPRLLDHSGGAIDSIAVLPLENLTGDPDQEYFVDGMTDELITELSKIQALRVISRTSVMQYKEATKPLPDIVRELNVDAVVEGSVFREGEQVRITVQLIGATPERHLWADSYDRDLGDILAMFSEVAETIAGEIQVTLTPQDQTRMAGARPVSPEAYELYLKGKYHYAWWNIEGWKKAIDYFQRAIAVDSSYALAYEGTADSYLLLGYYGELSREEALSKADQPLRKALEIEPTLAEAQETLAGINHYFYWDWRQAEEKYKLSIKLNPSLAETRFEYAICLMDMGRFDEAVTQAERAHQLDPLSGPTNSIVGLVYCFARRYDQAIAHYRQMAELEHSRILAYSGLEMVFEQLGRFEDAAKARQEWMTLYGASPEPIAALRRAVSESGSDGYWTWHVETEKSRFKPRPTYLAMYYAQLGDTDQAFANLEDAYETHAMEMHSLKSHPLFDPLRSDRRYQDLLRRMNFPEES